MKPTSIKRLLLATDFSDWARRAEEYACALAASWKIPLTVMTVLEFPPGMNPEYAVNKQYLTDRMDDASNRLAEFKQRTGRRGIVATTRIARGIPSEEVIAAAQSDDADLLVVGTRGKAGLAHVLLGSTAERVIRSAPCPVLAVHALRDDVPTEEDISIKRILVPTDLSDCSLDALEYAAVVAKQSQASVELLHVLEPVYYGIDFTFEHADDREKKRKRIAQALEDLSASLSKAGIITKTCIRGGMPPDTILEYVQTSASDLIVMGTHGRRGLSHLVAGSVTEAVLRHSTCPVLAVRKLPFDDAARRVILPARSSG
ncbi:MAG TPA: universal stress protein [Nitrospira sp.]|nr:universal stress protein [Nitrospira sp.]